MKFQISRLITVFTLLLSLNSNSKVKCEKIFSSIARVRYQKNLLSLRKTDYFELEAKIRIDLKFGKDWKNFFSKSEKLDLSFTNLDSSELKIILNSSPKASNLILASNPKLTEQDVTEALNKLRDLNGLNLYDTFGTQDSIVELIIKKHHLLEKLNLDRISGDKLLKLTALNNLHTLNITNSHIAEHNHLSNSQKPYITISDIENFIIQSPKSLKKLVLPDISGFNYNHLNKLAEEKKINLHFRPVYLNVIFSKDPKDVYDGDTPSLSLPWKIVSAFWGNKKKIRLRGVDTPEIRTKNQYEKIAAVAAKNFVYHFLAESEKIDLYEIDYGKYGGRILAYIDIIKLTDGKKYSLTHELLAHGLGVDYDGTRKPSTDDPYFWENHYKENKEIIDLWHNKSVKINKNKIK